MSSTIRETNAQAVSDQYILMEQLLPIELPGENEENIHQHPSSIIPYSTTLRMRNITKLSNEECANAIANHLQSSNRFMQDNRISRRFRLETVRAMPQSLTVKRSVKSQLLATVSQKSKEKPISYWKLLKYNISLKFRKLRTAAQNLLQTRKLWHQTIKAIESHCGSGIATYFKFLRWLLFLNIISCILSVLFIVIPQSLDQTHELHDIKALDFLTGSGFFSRTIMYYGFYSNDTVDTLFDTKYNIPSAYFLTLLFCYMLTFIVLSVKVISSYRETYVETRGKVHDLYSNKIFCGWDYSICSPKTATIQSASIYKELEELLAERRQHVPLHWFTKFSLVIMQLTVTVIVLFIICGIGMLVWKLLDHYDIGTSGSISVMVVPIVVTIIIHIFPTIISYLALLERYNNKRTELYITVVRNHAVIATIFGVLFAFWIINSTSDCWQTDFGGEIYRLVVLDFIASVLGVCVQILRSVLYEKYYTRIGRPEFDIARSTFHLIYNQTLFWMGFYFSPPMSLIIVIKMIVTFYIKKYEVKRCYQRPAQAWRAAQTQTLFLALAFLGIIGVLLTLGYIISNVESNDCGPFRDYSYTWRFIVDGMLSLRRDSRFWSVVSELARPGISAAILIGMCVAVYWLRAKVKASKEMLRILSDMILLQSQDKQFLIKNFANFNHESSRFVASESPSDSDHSEVGLIRHAAFIKRNEENERISRRRNLPFTSFEGR